MSLRLPYRKGSSKRTQERRDEDVVKSAMALIDGDSGLPSKRMKLSENQSQTIKPLLKEKQKIEILNVQVMCGPVMDAVENQSNERLDLEVTDNNGIISIIGVEENRNVETTEATKTINVQCEASNKTFDQDESDQEIYLFPKPKLSKDEQFVIALRNWSIQYNIYGSALSALLVILINYGLTFLPRDSRTFKSTPKEVIIRNVEPGIYWHYGIKRFLSTILKKLSGLPKVLTLNIFVDGLPIGRSSKGSFWPILGTFKEIPLMQPFVIGIYYHISKKPNCPKQLLEDVIKELFELRQSEFMNKIIKVGICVFDALASAFTRGVVSHNAYESCPKCTTFGSYHGGRTCYPSLNSTLRTDETFRSRANIGHHSEKFKTPNSTPLESLDIDIVKSCPLDYMHLILLGVVKKFLKMILMKMKYPKNALLRFKLNAINLPEIEKLIALARLYQPSDFCRKIRTLEYIKFFKATELRTFICYHGIVVLNGNIHNEFYECFKLLHCAVVICCSDKLIKIFLPVATELFKSFIKAFINIFGNCMVSYNVHNLQHVVEDVKLYGKLDNFSAFNFESQLGKLKKLLHGGKHPLHEVSNRIIEQEQYVSDNLKKVIEEPESYPKYTEYKLQLSSNIILTNKHENCWFITKTKKIVRFEKVKVIDEIPMIIGKSVVSTEDYYKLPIRSSLLGTYYSDGKLEEIAPIDFSEFSEKMFCIPDLKNMKVFLTILHT